MRLHVLSALFIWLLGHTAFGGDYPLWGDLRPGAHAVGFTARFEYDYSRTFRAKRDYEGKLILQPRARPIQIAVWYPATNAGKQPMAYEEYALLTGRELSFESLNTERKQAAIQQYIQQRTGFTRASEKAVRQLLQSPSAAIADAPAVPGKFPLIIYAPGASGTAIENPILCEYLASHGYIVAALPSMGPYTRNATVDLTGFYAYMQDIEFVIAKMRDFPGVDPDRLGIIGFSMGGSAATLVQMRNFDVDAAVYLDTGIIFDVVDTWFGPSNYYNKRELRAPQLYLTRADADGINLKFLDSIPYADSYSLLFNGGFRHVDFIADGMYAGLIPEYRPADIKDPIKLTQWVNTYTLHFLNGYIKNQPAGRRFLAATPEQNGVEAGLIKAEFRAAKKAPPREFEVGEMLRAANVDKVRQLLAEARKQDPSATIFREATVNGLGYEFLFLGNPQLAIEIFRLNIEAYPKSANAHDSLSEAYERTNNAAMALQYAQKAMELLSSDTTLDERRKEGVRRAAEQRIAKLREGSK